MLAQPSGESEVEENKMPGFDIENLLDFQPARRWCLRCLALWEDFSYFPHKYKYDTQHDLLFLRTDYDKYPILHNHISFKRDYNAFFIDAKREFLQCKICGLKYIATE